MLAAPPKAKDLVWYLNRYSGKDIVICETSHQAILLARKLRAEHAPFVEVEARYHLVHLKLSKG